ncbi:hypothetical protein [Streptomyces sp. ME19-01-6]|uniref:hypothetical protein n=1 Tax=Streptomyces sp. ME19-01-6 TaxID=3028686 RepID=UPI0029B119B7|nr:hypothetical protein [Streptomyces sp. ME19-01-6]MDX3224421.1 hypothetical protein [Streptomyces sp. ME19-01-6]
MLFKLYGIEDERQCASLRRLAKEIHKVDWWSNQGPMLRDTLKDCLTLEADSEVVRTYESVVIPGCFRPRRIHGRRFPCTRLRAWKSWWRRA